MKTVKLFDQDSYLRRFDAKVLSCEGSGDIFKIILDKTCFFPEAGGQPSDTGSLNGAAVIDVQTEGDEIVHYSRSPFDAGETVSGEIDFDRRFAFMQNHSGEHIVSGIVHRLFGFQNVGFHLNEEFVTMDFDGILSKEQLEKVEYLANNAVWEDRKITAFYPSHEEIKNISFRQKSGIEGELRLVRIEGVDICACCAPHVASTGQIGIIKFLSSEKMRGGSRIYMKCGGYALKDYREKLDSVTKFQNEFSVKPDKVYEGFIAFKKTLDDLKCENLSLRKRLISLTADAITEKVAFVEGFSMPELQKLGDLLYKNTGVTHTVFSGDGDGHSLVICGEEKEVEELFSRAKQSLNLKGGGRNGLICCRVSAAKEDIIREFSK